MSAIHPEDPLFEAIADLPRVEATAEHAERVRGRCRRRSSSRRSVCRSPSSPRRLEQSAGYAWQIATIATKVGLP